MSLRWFVSLYRVRARLRLRPEQAARERSHEMTRYLICVPQRRDGTHIPAEELPAVGEAAHAVVQEAMDAGVLVFGGGLAENVDPVMRGR